MNLSRHLLAMTALAVSLTCVPLDAAPEPVRHTFAIGQDDFLLDGQPFLIRCGEMHFTRIPREYWQHRLRLARAMGLNTVCAYLFWNVHEPQPGRFEFTGAADVAEFCRIAQAEGLKVILRPGPYSCAEWDFGGLPYWLLKIPDLKLRSQDPRFLEPARRYLEAVGAELAPLQITRGGPIIMVQVENEYGSYGEDRDYLGLIRDALKAAGFEVPFFTCDGGQELKRDARPDIFCAINFGGEPEQNFQQLREFRPTGPLMCAEFYPGWFDCWGSPHLQGHVADTPKMLREVEWMLGHNASFSIYMVHGGTSFGFTAGANSFPPAPLFLPQTTSYDYEAPISEAGWATPKYQEFRTLFLKHLAPGETLPDVPAPQPVITIAPLEFAEVSPLLAQLPAAKTSERPLCMEMTDQPQGTILYRTKLPAGGAGKLVITELHDYGVIFVDGRKIATLDRRKDENAVALPARETEATLDVLVDALGRVNYGPNIFDRKGITEKVELVTTDGAKELTGWQIFNLPMDAPELAGLRFTKGATEAPAFYRAKFQLAQVGDTFLDFSTWGKGVAWINGHNLGRFWRIGPQQTLYCPAPWLKKGENELIVFELDGAVRRVVTGLAEPILDQVR